MQNFPDASHLLGPWQIFMLLFVTLGPIKLLGPFMQLTRDADEATMKSRCVSRPARSCVFEPLRKEPWQ